MPRAASATGLLHELAACLAIPGVTPPGDAAAVADWVSTWCTEIGLSVRRQSVWPGADNVIATADFGKGPRLVFNSHLDVVDPAGQTWLRDPFRPEISDGRMYGRGACDAKGSLVAMIAALERACRTDGGLSGSVVLTAVVAEEAGGLGSRHLVQDGFTADAAVVGEPTGLTVARAHKGTYMHRVRFAGRAAHSASPHLGHDAIADAAAFVAACEAESARLACSPHPLLGPATLTVTTMSGGTFQNTVAAHAELTVDRRLVPGETHADADRELAGIVGELTRRRPGFAATVENLVATVPSETAGDQRIVQIALAAVAAVRGGSPRACGFNAGCDMSKLVGAGIPTVICGPGELAQAHAPDEFVPVQDVVDAAAIYERVVRLMLA